jgi:hypothetical protein
MKFTVSITIDTKKTGIDLASEIERIGFDPEDFNDTFPRKTINVKVSRDYVKENRDLFGDETTARAALQLEDTEPKHWEDWGSAGPMLSSKEISEETLGTLSLRFL